MTFFAFFFAAIPELVCGVMLRRLPNEQVVATWFKSQILPFMRLK